MRMRDLFITITEDETAVVSPSAKPKPGSYQGQAKKARYQDGSNGRAQKPTPAPRTTTAPKVPTSTSAD